MTINKSNDSLIKGEYSSRKDRTQLATVYCAAMFAPAKQKQREKAKFWKHNMLYCCAYTWKTTFTGR